MNTQTRRTFLKSVATTALATPLLAQAATNESFQLNYVLSSAMFGGMPLGTILPEVAKTGSVGIDIWGKPHGTQREQVETMGDEAFRALLNEHTAKFAVNTRYPLGPFGLADEMKWMKQFGGGIVITGSRGPQNVTGSQAKAAVTEFLEKMKPHVATAEENGVTIAIENHSSQLLFHPDSLRYFAELNRSRHLGIAFAPHHLHQWSDQIPSLIRDLGDDQIPFIYFQEHSEGMMTKSPKEIEMKQLPGFGDLDYRPIVKALREIQYTGLVEIFMHPVPRGVPILPTVKEITAAINTSRAYIEKCLVQTA